MKHAKHYLLLIIIVLLGGFLRFYKLDWGSGYFFHPDEYHIAAAVNRLSFSQQMNSELFSYGSFTVYLIYFTQKFLYQIITSYELRVTSFASAILIGRFYSALFSTLTIILVYLISRKVVSGQWSVVSAALCAAMPGLIQQAHFATPESILTFWLFLTLLMSLKKRFYLAAAALGVALGTKVVALTFLPIVFLPPVFIHFNRLNNSLQSIKQRFFFLLHLIKVEFFVIFITLLTFFFSFPYAFLDWPSFRGSLNYETGVARGQPVVFYTRQFISFPVLKGRGFLKASLQASFQALLINTTPVLFQFQKIFPYALGPGVLILGSLGFLGILGNLRKRKYYILHTTYYILLLAFLCYFPFNAFLFAKWTRFMTPVFPFFAIFAGYFFCLTKERKLLLVTCYLLLVINLILTAMFFSIYLKPDVRLTATDWLNQNLSLNSFILTESGNMLEVPLEGNLRKNAFDFYHLEENKKLQDQLPGLLTQTDYFIVQSRRIFANHQRLPEQFPLTSRFYDLLFNGQLGFKKIKEFSSFPTLKVRNFELEINDEMTEETWSVFDHPVIRIYKKTKILTTEDYEKLLKI